MDFERRLANNFGVKRDRYQFPIAVAGVFFLVYVLTLAHGMTLTGVSLTAKLAGWEPPPLDRPVTWLLTLPLTLLPAGWIPCALNLISAALAAMTLGLIAGCVELLPWDCVPDEKRFWQKKFPAMLAVAVCGLELNFWSEATATIGEMAGLFLLAVALWSLLKFRVKQKMGWLETSIILWGAGCAENWFMVITTPFFVAGIIWLLGWHFFEKKFLTRAALLGLAGWSIIFLPPFIEQFNPHTSLSLTATWLFPFQSLKNTLGQLHHYFWSWHRMIGLVVVLFFGLPVFACLARMKNEAAPNLPELQRYQIWFFRALRAVLLLLCLWLAFDPIAGPREIIRQQTGLNFTLVSLDFLNALGIAYLTGSLLFAAHQPALADGRRSAKKISIRLRALIFPLMAVLSLGIVVGLFVRNAGTIWSENHHPAQNFGETVSRALPVGGGILLGENPVKLYAIKAAMSTRPDAKKWRVAVPESLTDAKYRATLGEDFAPKAGALNAAGLSKLFQTLSPANRIFFLDPHAGNFLFESMEPRPGTLVSELKWYAESKFIQTPIAAAEIGRGEKFWDDNWRESLAKLAADNTPKTFPNSLRRRLALEPARRDQTAELARWYSTALNNWGVILQTAGNLRAARNRFTQALALNTNNFAAQLNLNCNSNLLAGAPMALTDPRLFAQKFPTAHQTAAAVAAWGEMDEPTMRCAVGAACLATGWPRQAWAEFERARTLAPNDPTPSLALAQLYSQMRMDYETLKITSALREKFSATSPNISLDTELTLLEAKSWASRTNFVQAEKILTDLQARYPENLAVAEKIFRAYLALDDTTNAFRLVDARLKKNPDDVAALNNRAALLVETHRAAEALPVLEHALALTNAPAIFLNRAIAETQTGNLTAAENDYAELKNAAVDQFSVHFGLAEIAGRRQETNTSIRELECCLTNTPAGSLKWQQASARLETLKNQKGR
jgi:tetratricopeptide (TPR) repeat protein